MPRRWQVQAVGEFFFLFPLLLYSFHFRKLSVLLFFIFYLYIFTDKYRKKTCQATAWKNFVCWWCGAYTIYIISIEEGEKESFLTQSTAVGTVCNVTKCSINKLIFHSTCQFGFATRWLLERKERRKIKANKRWSSFFLHFLSFAIHYLSRRLFP